MALQSLVPDADLYVENNDWDRVTWRDDRSQPSKADADAAEKSSSVEGYGPALPSEGIRDYRSYLGAIHQLSGRREDLHHHRYRGR